MLRLPGESDGAQTLLQTADAQHEGGDLGVITWTFTVPADLEPGRATLLTEAGPPLRVRIVRR